MRYKETEEIEALFGDAFMDLHVVHAGELFLSKLDEVSDPEEKRKIMEIRLLMSFRKARELSGDVTYLAQGTLYPDVIESVSTNGDY